MTSEILGSSFRARSRPDGRWDVECGAAEGRVTIEATDLAAIIIEPSIDVRSRNRSGGQGPDT